MAGPGDLWRWLGTYADFTLDALKNSLFARWFPQWLKSQAWIEEKYPRLWLRMLNFSYGLGIERKYWSVKM
jgi:lycopene cyclase CruA